MQAASDSFDQQPKPAQEQIRTTKKLYTRPLLKKHGKFEDKTQQGISGGGSPAGLTVIPFG